MSENNIKIVKISILCIPIFVMWISDFLLAFPMSILMTTLMTNLETATWFPVTMVLLTPIKIAISAVAVYYAMTQWNKYFPPVK